MLLDKVMAQLAPYYCINCAKIGYVLCPDCQENRLDKSPSRCYRCHAVTTQYQVCAKCRVASPLKHVWVVAGYKDLAKEAVDLMKFERAGAASKDLARAMSEILPLLPKDTIVCHIPTAPNRIRIRGYDQSKLIAKEIAGICGFSYVPLLVRLTSTRQVGSGREERIKQANKAFGISSKTPLNDKQVLIVDDVTTSGATIEAAAKLLKQAGAKTVDAVVFAQAVE